ncbi:MAG: riboflavin biosynthesis protein RibF [Phycisphaerae bacterium]|jgi:riboflavin kinase/FMN adenylyltransferase
MEVCHGIESFTPSRYGVTLTIGNFDGVHRGHQRIIERARSAATALGTPVVALTFEPHPAAVLSPQRAPARLVTAEEKLHLLAACGVDACVVARSTPELFAQTADAFLALIAERCRPRAIVEGPDFNFGRGRGGSVQTLRDAASRYGYEVHVVETTACPELAGAPPVRSSAIRAALREGGADVAAAMLGRPHRVTGIVGHGASRGRTLGFPTANLDAIPQLLPAEAVYAAAAQLLDGSWRPAAVNVGPQPTFEQSQSRVEAYLLDWDQPLVGQRLGLHLLRRLRGQRRFDGPQELIEQIRQDVTETRAAAAEFLRVPPSVVAPL